MKKLSLFTLAVMVSVFTLHANPDSLLAHYPLLADGIDVTGNNDEMVIQNAPFQDGGIYSNGIYIGNDTLGSYIQTPFINDFNFDEFTVSFEFKIDSYPAFRSPIIIGGVLWRWIGAYIQEEHLVFLANDFSEYVITDEVISLDQWHTIRLTYNREQKQALMFFDSKLVADVLIPVLEHNGESRFLNDHGGVGETFKGYWRNLQIFDVSTPTAVQENNELEGIEVFVNRNQLNIQIPPTEKEVLLQIVDLSGTQLSSHRLQDGSNQISTGFVKTANYLLVFTNNKGEKAVRKVFIAN